MPRELRSPRRQGDGAAGGLSVIVREEATPPKKFHHYTGELGAMTVAVLAEKPSVARDIAKVLGAATKGEGYLHGNGYVVTWAIGHLAALAQPHEIHPRWKSWRRETLPMLPEVWPRGV